MRIEKSGSLIFFCKSTCIVSFLYYPKSIKYLSIKYLSRDNKRIVELIGVVKTAILNTYILNTIE